MADLTYGPFITRAIALQKGYTRYYVNQPCKHGHVAPRSTKTRNCSRCDCDRKKKDPTTVWKQRRKPLTQKQQRVRDRLDQMNVPNFTYWASLGVFVYCYLSKNLKPYYIGVASTSKRPIAPHSFKVPKDRRLIRIMKSGLTWDQAAEWEKRFIAHFGRKDKGTGCLWNMTDGGEGRFGCALSDETKEAISLAHRGSAEEAANKYRIPLDIYLSFEKGVRGALKTWLDRHPDKGYQDYFSRDPEVDFAEAIARAGRTRAANTAKRVGVPLDVWMEWDRDERNRYNAWVKSKEGRNYQQYLTRHDQPHWAEGTKQSADLIAKRIRPMLEKTASEFGIPAQWWIDANDQQRSALRARFTRGVRGVGELTKDLEYEGVNPRVVRAAKRFEVSVEWWESANVQMRNALRARFYRGVRGQTELTAGL